MKALSKHDLEEAFVFGIEERLSEGLQKVDLEGNQLEHKHCGEGFLKLRTQKLLFQNPGDLLRKLEEQRVEFMKLLEIAVVRLQIDLELLLH